MFLSHSAHMEHPDTFPINRDKQGEIMGKKRLRSPGKSI